MPTPEAPLVWTEPFRVRAYEVGPGDLASPLAICDYFQEAAGEHAEALGIETFDLGASGAGWVLSRLAVQFERLPLWREAVTVETWPSGIDGLRATRDLLLRDARGDILARARTVWFVFDIARRRPVRLPPAVVAIDPPDGEPALVLAASPLAPEAASVSRSFRVRLADLDRNAHVNNVRFAEWALEATPEAPGWDRLRSLDIAFKGEAVAGDTVVSEAQASGGGAVAHAILRETDRAPLAVARTLWS